MLAQSPRLHRPIVHERPESADRVEQRAMEFWPRLDRHALHRCQGDPARIAIQVAHRTKIGRKAIARMIADR